MQYALLLRIFHAIDQMLAQHPGIHLDKQYADHLVITSGE